MNILVTGGAGYIGSHAHRHLLDKGHAVFVIDDLSHGFSWAIDKRARFYEGNISDSKLVRKILDENKIEAVMHFAAFIEVAESVANPKKYIENNFSNALKLLEIMIEVGVNKFIFSSTAAVYGNPSSIPVLETAKCAPINPYGESKWMLEKALADLATKHPLKYMILRYFNVAGACPKGLLGEAHEPETHLIPRILLAALGEADFVSIFGTDYETFDGTCVRDYVHVEDLADAHHLALLALNQDPSNIYNLGSEKGFSVRQILKACNDVVGKIIPTKEFGRRPGDPPVLVASREKIVRDLKWKPRYSEIEKIVEHAWKWHRSRRK
ncbi:MAG: UDP-glucose 4-epimerase GalE [Bacteriovoracaceae bacterium]|nr:UDP-glucose 4-epimerase GalE [Bacteriovoracaceae bacterium]